MSKKKKKKSDWAEAKRLCRLNDEEIGMAQALGFAPHSLIKNIPSPKQQWKKPVAEWVRVLYEGEFPDSLHAPGCEFPIFQPAIPRGELVAAAEYVTREISKLPEVVKVSAFDGLAQHSSRKSSRHTELSVWITDLTRLQELEKARKSALDRLREERGVHVASRQVIIHLLEPQSDRYRGRLCFLEQCPTPGEKACNVGGCGAQLFLRQERGYLFNPMEPEDGLFNYEEPWMAGDWGEITDEDVPF